MKIDFIAMTDAGPRSQNEDTADAWRLQDGSVCLAVADGLGGRGAGGAASEIALKVLRERITQFPDDTMHVQEVFAEIHREIKRQQERRDDQRFMATTLTAVYIGRGHICGAHGGDSRAMIARGNGIKKLTLDHSEAQRLLDEGKISKAEFESYPRKHILESALGSEDEPRIDPIDFPLLEGDRVFVTSDGFHLKIPLRPMLKISKRCNSASAFAREAMQEVQKNEPNDNFSLAVAYIEDTP